MWMPHPGSGRILEVRYIGCKDKCTVWRGRAGTFSDGKLTTRIHDPRCGYVMEQLARFGAPAQTMRRAKPHIGTDKLRMVVKNIRRESNGWR